jgi:hypothetical protein
MEFNAFQTESGTLKKIGTDFGGDETVISSHNVSVDPVFGFKRITTRENEEITGLRTIITSPTLENDYDLSHRNWKLEYKGTDYQIEQPVPFYTIGTNNLEHIEVILR